MTSVEVRVVLALPAIRSAACEAPRHSHTPRTIKEFVATFVQLHAFSVELLFDEEGFPLHFFDTIFEFSGSPAKHRRESSEEMRPFILWMISEMLGAQTETPYFLAKPFVWIPQTPRNFLYVGTSIIQVLCVRMKYAENGRVFN